MAEESKRKQYVIPIAFQIAGDSREDAAGALYDLLTTARIGIDDEADAAFTSAQPVNAWWFPEQELKHIDGNTRSARALYDDRPFLTAYDGSPVLDTLEEIFPKEPNQDDYRRDDGTLDEAAYNDAYMDFTEDALEVLADVQYSTRAQRRVVEDQDLRDALSDLLERAPLPVEPHKDDYLVTVAPGYEGEFEGARYRWDHTQWEADFLTAARAREARLRELAVQGGSPSQALPVRFQHDWVPRDLVALQALRDLIDQEASPLPPRRLLSREARARLQGVLHEADLDVRVEGPNGQVLYAGASSRAAGSLDAGVYDAVTVFGNQPARLVVGPVGPHNAPVSAAFRVNEHESSALDEIALTIQAVPDDELRSRLAHVLETTGRSGRRITQAKTPLEHGVLLNELLHKRRTQLDRDAVSDGSDPPPQRVIGPEYPGR